MLGIVVTIIVVIIIIVLIASRQSDSNSSYTSRETVIGRRGENTVASIIAALPEQYISINNVIIPNRQGTSQIDHVVVSPYGIFVIETKNYSGWIFGAENNKRWKETFRTTGGTYFNNPIKQNWGHIYALSEYLNLDKKAFRPVVVFSDEATLNVEADTPVIFMSQLRNHILSFRQEIIPREAVISIFNRISKVNLIGEENEQKHVQSVRQNLANKKNAVQNGICPQCGGRLVLRHGIYGEFYGCSSYPNCRYTRDINKM